MPVFTAAATAILGAFGVAGTIAGSAMLFNLAVGVVATGLAMGTAKLFGVYDTPKLPDSKDPGVKIQLPPATDNKVPRLYGRNYTGSIIIDAEIKNQNKTMAYAMVISEYNSNDVWTINDIYRGDAKLIFSGHTVTGQLDPNSTSNTQVNGKLRCRVYAGGSTAAHQIFPTTGAVNAYDMFSNWTAANTMTDLVFAVFEIDYDAENGLTGLGAITFDINNSINNPSLVLQDYLLNSRYGAKLTVNDIDQTSFDNWESFCNELVTYTPAAGGSAQHKRYQIDGALSTFATAKDNINKICLSGGAFFTFNNKTGLFGVVINRAVSAQEEADAFVLNDDNLVDKIQITSTELFSLFNAAEVEYPSVNQKDQTDVVYLDVDPGLLHPNEPENVLQYRLEMCNDKARVTQLATVDLNQARLNTILDVVADHSAMQVDVGDVVKLTSALYGFNNKLFRAMRVTEQEDQDGLITVRIVLLEYDADIYGDLITQEDLPKNDTGVSNWWKVNSDQGLTIGNVIIVNDPEATTGTVHNPATGIEVGTETLANIKLNYGSPYTSQAFVIVPITPAAGTAYNIARIQVYDDTDPLATVTPVTITRSTENESGYFTPEEVYYFSFNSFEFNSETVFHMEIVMEDSVSGARSIKYITGQFQTRPQNIIKPDALKPGTGGLTFYKDYAHVQIPQAALGSAVWSSDADYNWVYLWNVYWDLWDQEYWGGPDINGDPPVMNPATHYITNTKFLGEYWAHNVMSMTGQYTIDVDLITTGGQVLINVEYDSNITNWLDPSEYTTDFNTWLDNRNLAYHDPGLPTIVAWLAGRTDENTDSIPGDYVINVFPFVREGAVRLYLDFIGTTNIPDLNAAGQRGWKVTTAMVKLNKAPMPEDDIVAYPSAIDWPPIG